MNTIYKNARPVLGSLISKLQHSFVIDAFYDGNDWLPVTGHTEREQRQNLKNIIVVQKRGLIRVLNRDSISRTIEVSIHRSPEDLARYSGAVDEDMTVAIQEFKELWNGRAWPSK